MKTFLLYAIFIYPIDCGGCEPINSLAVGFDNRPMMSYESCEFMKRAALSYYAIYRDEIVNATCTVVGKVGITDG